MNRTGSARRDMAMAAATASLAVALAGLAMAGAGRATADTPAPLVVMELFQSQGCSSCPPANANLNAVADRPGLLALSFGVTYWDELGWKDTFATPQYTARQWDYAHGLHHDEVGTPQVVLNGRRDIVGADRGELEAAIRTAAPADAATVTVSPAEVRIAASTRTVAAADVWMVRYDPRLQQVSIRRGENGGKTLPHRNIVRQLVRLGAWSGAAAHYALPAAADPALRTAVLVQTMAGGPILGAGRG